jgi:hypothetical protein
MVDSDGSTYVEYEVREIPHSDPPSSILWLMKIAPDGTTTTTQLSSSSSANLFPGNILPDGQGGVLATWTIANPNPPPAPQPYQGAYVTAGGGITMYPLPLAPASLVTGNDGLPVNPTLVLGENGAVFVSYGANITSFELSTGLANWNYQAPSQTGLSLISYSNGGGLVGKMTTTSGTDTVLRFDSAGNATADAWSGSDTDYSIDKSFWTGSLASCALCDFSAQSVDSTPSLSPSPHQKRLNRAYPISIKVNFAGANFTTPKTTGDLLNFQGPNTRGPCAETLGLQDCLQQSGYWLWNLEIAARAYDDASKWSLVRKDQFRYKGFYIDENDNPNNPFSCFRIDPYDGPTKDFWQKPAGQNQIFSIDAPGPFNLVNPVDACKGSITLSPIYSQMYYVNFQLDVSSLVTGFHRTIYYHVNVVVGSGRQLDRINSRAGYGNISLNF